MTCAVEALPIHHRDETIADGARISFAKRAEMFTHEKNVSLLKHLAKFRHWSPYGHAREAFLISIFEEDMLYFLENAVLAGFSWVREGNTTWIVNGSLWAWYENLTWLPKKIGVEIAAFLCATYPEAGKILFPAFAGSNHLYPVVAKPLSASQIPDTAKYAKVLYASLRIRAPIWVARQLVKHQVHLCWNEESRRYITDEPTFFLGEMRKASESVKQGSLPEEIEDAPFVRAIIESHHNRCSDLYRRLLGEFQLAPEIARGVLALNLETNWIWTGSLHAWNRVCGERIAPGAQKETMQTSELIEKAIMPLYKSWYEIRQLPAPVEKPRVWELPSSA